MGMKTALKNMFQMGWTNSYLHQFEINREEYASPDHGENACPPEDCGGIRGYYELLEIVKNPDHPDHEEKATWLGHFDPAELDLAETKVLPLRQNTSLPPMISLKLK